MEAFFREILSSNSDSRTPIVEALPTIHDWISSSSDRENWAERHTICKLDKHTEVVIRRWTKGEGTPFHLHPNQTCWFYVLEGEIEEIRLPYKPDLEMSEDLICWDSFKAKHKDREDWSFFENAKKVSLLPEGTWHYIDDSMGFHKMGGASEIALSLHIYRKLVP